VKNRYAIFVPNYFNHENDLVRFIGEREHRVTFHGLHDENVYYYADFTEEEITYLILTYGPDLVVIKQ